MCGIFCSLNTGTHVLPSEQILHRLRGRGPDGNSTIRIETTPDEDSSCKVVLCSTVLSMRGSCITQQPYQDVTGNYVLCWNGEAWRIDNESSIEDDTIAMYNVLSETLKNHAGDYRASDGRDRAHWIATAISRVAGPYAFAFFDRELGHLFFGRDFLGRRSLCWSTTEDGGFVLCSVTDGLSAHGWQEVEANGVYFVDVTNFVRTARSPIKSLTGQDATPSPATSVPYRYIGGRASVHPRLCLLRELPSLTSPLSHTSPVVAHLLSLLRESLAPRVLNVPDTLDHLRSHHRPKVAILFSGGLDCTVLARLSHDLLPKDESIDLLNVAFENPRIHADLEGGSNAAYELCPDRITGRTSFAELQSVCIGRLFRFVATNIPYSETMQHRHEVISLMHPHNTEMDLSIASALYFAARGIGQVVDPDTGATNAYASPARVLLSGLGADELFGGYTRHATAFKRAGLPGLIDELELDVSRLGKRNLGRDDRVISHWGKEARFPFLDEALLTWALNAPVTDKCGFGEPPLEHVDGSAGLEAGKKVLRCLAWTLGMKSVAKEKKRAIQFGTRTAKMETGKTKGTTLLS